MKPVEPTSEAIFKAFDRRDFAGGVFELISTTFIYALNEVSTLLEGLNGF